MCAVNRLNITSYISGEKGENTASHTVGKYDIRHGAQAFWLSRKKVVCIDILGEEYWGIQIGFSVEAVVFRLTSIYKSDFPKPCYTLEDSFCCSNQCLRFCNRQENLDPDSVLYLAEQTRLIVI